ncbi:MAG: tetratricopeptide repeat protein [Treponema sp.]|jgi:tetratricopeptide (TPR) repeat protein|nr:tetratricopeptide repeat protein [Treponema sp.]
MKRKLSCCFALCALPLAVLPGAAQEAGAFAGAAGGRVAASHVEKGRMFSDRKDYEAALAEFTEAIRIDPEYAAPYNNRGLAYYGKKDYGRAMADSVQALKLVFNFTTIKNNLERAWK